MANRKEPIDLLLAKGRKHLTKAEIEARKAHEIRAPVGEIFAPSYLTKAQKTKFDRIAELLLEIGIMTELDCDALARYLMSEEKYRKYDRMVNKIMAEAKDFGRIAAVCEVLTKVEGLRDKALKQCRAAASDLGLTISSRCKLVVPKAAEPPGENKFARFTG